MALQDTKSKSERVLPEPPEMKHIKILHRRHDSGIHEPPTEMLVKAQDAHRPHNIPLSEEIVAKDAGAQADKDTPEGFKKPAITTHKAPTVPSGTPPPPYPYSCIGIITVGTGNQVLWTGTGIMCQPKSVNFLILLRDIADITPNPRLLLTAGHTCPWHVENPWMTFAPGFNDGSEPYGVANVTQGYGYDVSPVSEFDMAICVLDQDIGESCGWVATVWNTSDSGYEQYPFQLLGLAGYPNYTDPSYNTLLTDTGTIQPITVPAESGHFKLLNLPIYSAFYSAVLWTNFNNMVCCGGVLSGSDGESGLGFAGGEALGDLLTAVRISMSTAFRIALTHHRVFSAGAGISWSAWSTHIGSNWR
jgi:hypothetical protein